MEQEWANNKRSIKKRLQRLRVGTAVHVEASRPSVGLITGEERKREQNGPPRQQGMKRMRITAD